MYFEFNLTAIRQAIAASICLLAYMVLLESKQKHIIKYIILVTVAVLVHKSAFAAYFLLPLLWIKNIKIVSGLVVLMSVGGIVVRSTVLSFIKLVFIKESLNVNSSLYIGGNLIFLAGLAAFFVLVEVIREKQAQNELEENESHESYNAILGRKRNEVGMALNYDYQNVFVKSFVLSIFFMVIFGMENAARCYMILNQVIIISLPNVFEQLESKSRRIAIFGCCVFMLAFFYTNTLLANNFDIVPYQFFWSNR